MCFPRAFICGFNEIAHQRWKTANPDPIQRRGNLSRGDTEQNPRLIFGLTGLAQDHFLVFNITAYSTGICFQSQIFQIKHCKKMRHTAKSRITFYPPFRHQDTTGKTELRGFLKPSFSFHPPWLVFLKGEFLLSWSKPWRPLICPFPKCHRGVSLRDHYCKDFP